MSQRFDQSEERPFKSIFKEGYVTPPNYLCELIFQRRGEYDKNTSPQYLWNSAKFKSAYVGQLVHINKLLKDYSISTLIRAFNETKILSVTNPNYLLKVKEIHSRTDNVDRVITKTESVVDKPKAPYGKPNKFEEL